MAHVENKKRENQFYQRHYHFFFYGMFTVIFILIAMISLVLYQLTHKPLPAFYAVQPDQQKMSLTPFITPNLLPDTILHWASQAATAAYTFDYVNYNAQLRIARPYFTEAGWQVYLSAVRVLITTITQNQLFVNGVVAGTPVITNQGPLPGQDMVWRVQIPFLVSYQSASALSKRNFVVVLTIVAVPTSIHPQGIGIDQFIMVER